MRLVRWQPSAKLDARDIWRWIAADSPRAADRLLARFDEVFAMLVHSPGAGRARRELAHGLRSFPISEYVAFYLERNDGVEIVRILHGHRDIDSGLF